MKKLRYLPLVAVLGLASLTSCEKYFGDVNVDPTRPTDVTPTVLLPSAQVEYAYGMAGDISRLPLL